jgi:hypothetical protein
MQIQKSKFISEQFGHPFAAALRLSAVRFTPESSRRRHAPRVINVGPRLALLREGMWNQLFM